MTTETTEQLIEEVIEIQELNNKKITISNLTEADKARIISNQINENADFLADAISKVQEEAVSLRRNPNSPLARELFVSAFVKAIDDVCDKDFIGMFNEIMQSRAQAKRGMSRSSDATELRLFNRDMAQFVNESVARAY